MRKILILKPLFLLVILSACLFISCQKLVDSVIQNQATAFEKYFESSVLNQNFIVILASNNGTDITSHYNGYQFMMLKTDYYHGPIQVTKGSSAFNGTWSSNEDYSKLVITLPASPPEFIFLTREWRFTGKILPELDFAPWGTTDPLVLHILRQ